jgi:ribosomal protein S18 acetylase RimI-like enzyme
MVVTSNSKPKTLTGLLRPFDFYRDLPAVADLIESCFSLTLDSDGRRYIRKMRIEAQRSGSRNWSKQPTRSNLFSISGYVWEEDGQVVGNLSLVPFSYKRKRIYLIANVAVKPEYRRCGIAKSLTDAALEKWHQSRSDAIWLQVRDDNKAAQDLYLKKGFKIQARRINWVVNPQDLHGKASEGLRVTFRRINHWSYHRMWLDIAYPENLRWHFKNDLEVISPGFGRLYSRLINESVVLHWSVLRRDEILGIVSWQRSSRYSDHLWLASRFDYEDEVLSAVIPRFHNDPRFSRPISLNYPDDRAVEALSNLGFEIKTNLIWMEINKR